MEQKLKEEKDEDGTYFIDREGKYFKYILEWLLYGKIYPPIKINKYNTKIIMDRIIEKVNFYGLQNMINELTLSPLDTLLLTNPQSEQLHECKLLYRASRDGQQATNFHQTCDNKSSTIVIIKSNNGSVLGGYNAIN